MPSDQNPNLTDIMDNIRGEQAHKTQFRLPPQKHEPEMLYIGCVDARLDPIDDIGIKKGKALIFRNIAATVFPSNAEQKNAKALDGSAPVTDDTVSADASLGATLEFFLRHLPEKPGIVKHIVVSGHTDCGGIKACSQACKHNQWDERDAYLPQYFKPVEGLFHSDHLANDDALRELERASVRNSVENLMSYPVVREAMANDKVRLHGWVIDTATGRIAEMDQLTKEFKPMATVEKDFTSLEGREPSHSRWTER